MHLREKDLENHFETEGKSAPPAGKKDDKKEEKTDNLSQKPEDNLKNDYQVLRALDLLKGWELIKSMDAGK
jgi:carboxyl-terminal processing protease